MQPPIEVVEDVFAQKEADASLNEVQDSLQREAAEHRTLETSLEESNGHLQKNKGNF